MLAPPCSSFSLAQTRTVTLRNQLHPRGLPNVAFTDRERERIDLGNRILDVVIKLIQLCRRHRIPFCLEQPRTSFMLHDKFLQHALSTCEAEWVTVDQCSFGARWKKPTTLIFGFSKRSPQQCRRCHGKHGWCSFRPGHKHIVLDGSSRTRAAAAYPPRLSHWIVNYIF